MENRKGSVLWSSKAWQRWINYVCECLGMSVFPTAGLWQRSWKLLYHHLLLNIVVKFQCKEPSNQTSMETLMPFIMFLCSIVQFSLYLNTYRAYKCLGDAIMPCLINILLFSFYLLIYVFLKIIINYFIYGEVTMFLRICLLHLWCEMSHF